MQTSYIYSASKANALSQDLLNKTDIERLLAADSGVELQSALKETYLASYVLQVPDESVSLAVEETLRHAKKLIHRVTPNSNMFRVMWVRYDIHNLRVFAKATAVDLPVEQVQEYLSERGIYDSSYLYEHIENRTLNNLQMGWQEAYDSAVQTMSDGDLSQMDGVLDELYFVTIKRIVELSGDSFMGTYLQALIDIYNLQSNLRHLQNATVSFSPAFVTGGSFSASQIETSDQVFAALAQLGGAEYWTSALEFYKETGHFTQFDSKAADYLLTVAKEGSYDMFSPASLVLYYLKCQQAAANVRTIVVGKNGGHDADSIRSNLRLAYVND